MKNYQTHDSGMQSISDTERKLVRLQIPQDLTGKRVLDVGCNEGFFCNLASQRGAISVVGIDFVKENIDFAESTYAHENIKFLHQNWSNLPEGPFDLVIWSSAMHYDLDPRSVIDNIKDVMAPDGLLILECGVTYGAGREFLPNPRIADTRWYPSMQFLVDEILREFSVRNIAQPEIAEGDFVPRTVFHCNKLLPSIIIVNGATKTGKSTISRLLDSSVTKLLSLDLLVTRMGNNKYPHNSLENFMSSNYDPRDLGKIYSNIDGAGLTDEFAELIANGVSHSDRVIVIEGCLTDQQYSALAQKLKSRAYVWTMNRA